MANPLSREEVEEIALLARLALTDDEIERLRGELGAILAHMDALQEVDVAEVAPMTHAVPMHMRLRPDRVEPSLSPNDAVGGAPERAGEYFQVPHIIESTSGE